MNVLVHSFRLPLRTPTGTRNVSRVDGQKNQRGVNRMHAMRGDKYRTSGGRSETGSKHFARRFGVQLWGRWMGGRMRLRRQEEKLLTPTLPLPLPPRTTSKQKA